MHLAESHIGVPTGDRDDIVEWLQHVVVVEDEPSDLYLIERKIRQAWPSVRVTPVDSLDQLDHEITNNQVDMVLSDFRMPHLSGLAVLEYLEQQHPDMPVIIVSGAVGEELAVELIKSGAADFVLKDRLERLPRSIYQALQQKRLRGLKERAEAEMKLVTYILSHDLRAPLNNLTALNHLIHERWPEDEIVERMERSLSSLKGTIDGLGQLVKQTNPEENASSAVMIKEVLDEIETDLGAQIHATGAALIRKGYEGTLTTNRPYLKSMLSNLISNALKYHKPDVAPRIEIEIRKRDPWLHIRVADNGIGIDLEKEGSQVFRPFKRLLANKKDGFGLGLYIVKRQVENLNGSVHVKSTRGKGSEFEIKLPLKE